MPENILFHPNPYHPVLLQPHQLQWIDFAEILPECALICDYNVVTCDSDILIHAVDIITRIF